MLGKLFASENCLDEHRILKKKNNNKLIHNFKVFEEDRKEQINEIKKKETEENKHLSDAQGNINIRLQ